MTSGDAPERRLAEALRARATGAGARGPTRTTAASARPAATGVDLRTALLIALLGGAVLGALLALVSLLVPGLLPPLG